MIRYRKFSPRTTSIRYLSQKHLILSPLVLGNLKSMNKIKVKKMDTKRKTPKINTRNTKALRNKNQRKQFRQPQRDLPHNLTVNSNLQKLQTPVERRRRHMTFLFQKLASCSKANNLSPAGSKVSNLIRRVNQIKLDSPCSWQIKLIYKFSRTLSMRGRARKFWGRKNVMKWQGQYWRSCQFTHQ